MSHFGEKVFNDTMNSLSSPELAIKSGSWSWRRPERADDAGATPPRVVAEVVAAEAPDAATRALAWSGEITAANAEDVSRMTSEHMRSFVDDGAKVVIVNLERLQFMDSAGAALMLRLTKWARELSARVLFTHPPENVRRVLRLVRLEQLLLDGSP